MALKQLTVYIDDEDPWRETFCPIDGTTGAADLVHAGLYRCGGGHYWKWVEENGS